MNPSRSGARGGRRAPTGQPRVLLIEHASNLQNIRAAERHHREHVAAAVLEQRQVAQQRRGRYFLVDVSDAARAPFSQVYLLVNSKLEPEFKMPDHNLAEVLGRAIAVALNSGLRAQVALISAAAPRHGIALHIAPVPGSFDHPSHGAFDGKYMKALYALGVEAGKQGTAFQDAALRGAGGVR